MPPRFDDKLNAEPAHRLLVSSFLIFSSPNLLSYAVTIFVGPLSTRYREYRVYIQYTGLTLAVLGILLSGFATKPWHLIITSGIIYPIGATIMWMPIATLTFEWFVKRRGLSTGILFAGTGLGGAIFPIVMQTLLDKYSYKAASVSLVSLDCFGMRTTHRELLIIWISGIRLWSYWSISYPFHQRTPANYQEALCGVSTCTTSVVVFPQDKRLLRFPRRRCRLLAWSYSTWYLYAVVCC